MIFILLAIMAYLSAGTIIARSINAKQRYALSCDPGAEKRKELVFDLDNIKHGSSCYRNPSSSYYNTSRNCDCDHSAHWKRIRVEIESAKRASVKVTNPYLILVGWPFIGYHNVLTSGTVKGVSRYDHNLTMQLERVAGIPPLEIER